MFLGKYCFENLEIFKVKQFLTYQVKSDQSGGSPHCWWCTGPGKPAKENRMMAEYNNVYCLLYTGSIQFERKEIWCVLMQIDSDARIIQSQILFLFCIQNIF
jgi:hypothetical protein